MRASGECTAGDKDGVREWGKMRPLIDSIGCVRAEFFADLSICAALCGVCRRVARGKGFSVVGGAYGEGRREKDVAVHRTTVTRLYRQLPRLQISGLGSCVSLKL